MGVEWIHPAQDMIKWSAPVDTVMKICVKISLAFLDQVSDYRLLISHFL